MPHFLPFIGSAYSSGGIFKKKILILGESHHCSPEDDKSDLTNVVIQTYLNRPDGFENWMNTFTKFERSLVGYETNEDDRRKIWESVIFYNYLQVPMSESRIAGSSQEYKASEKAFFSVLEQYKPEYLIVWGNRLWDYTPSEGFEQSPDIIIDGKALGHGVYTLKSGHKVKIFCVNHPSTGYSWEFWHKGISQWWH